MPLGLLTITWHDCAVRIGPGSLCFHYIMYSKSADELQLPAQQKQTFSHLHSKYMYIHIYIYLNSLFFILLIKPFLRWNRRTNEAGVHSHSRRETNTRNKWIYQQMSCAEMQMHSCTIVIHSEIFRIIQLLHLMHTWSKSNINREMFLCCRKSLI